MAKRPSFQFYPGDWLKDPAVRACSPTARGVWIDMICTMFEQKEAGKNPMLSLSVPQMSRMFACTEKEAVDSLQELTETGAADVEKIGDKFNIINRRISREHDMLAYEREKKRRMREAKKKKSVPTLSRKCPGNVPLSSSSSSSSSSSTSTSVYKSRELPPDGGKPHDQKTQSSHDEKPPKKKPKPDPLENHPALATAYPQIIDAMKAHGHITPPKADDHHAWRDELRKAVELDGKAAHEIAESLLWVFGPDYKPNGDFSWAGVIQSLRGIRNDPRKNGRKIDQVISAWRKASPRKPTKNPPAAQDALLCAECGWSGPAASLAIHEDYATMADPPSEAYVCPACKSANLEDAEGNDLKC